MMGPVEIRFHPAARRPLAAAGVAAAVGMVAGAAWAVLPEPAVVLPLLAILVLSLLPFYAPTDYRLDDAGIEVRRAGTRRLLPWSRFRAFQVDRNGVQLVRLGKRGEFLPMDAEARRQALPALQERLEAR